MKIISNKIRCKRCGDIIESKSEHDLQTCSCKSIAVDGGLIMPKRIGKRADWWEYSIVIYLNEEIVLRDDLPEPLKRDFEELQAYHDAGDWQMYDLNCEAIEATVKANYHAGLISREDLDLIFRKFGMG